MPRIDHFEIYKVETPTGRLIGDNNCAYDSLDLICLCLKTSDGLEGWGYGETISKGKFSKPAFNIMPMAPLAQVREEFIARWWPILHAADFLQKGLPLEEGGDRDAPFFYLESAVRIACWDLRAQQAGLPLWRFLGKESGSRKVRAYGSLLDFNLSDAEAAAKAKDFLARGFKIIKVKIGAPDIQRDIARLKLIIGTVPRDVQVTADANIAWSARQTIEALQNFAAAGINLGYIEDPIPHTDIDGWRRLAEARKSGEISIPITAHDYAPTAESMKRLLETGAITFVRNGQDIDHSLKVRRLCQEFGLKMIICNSMFEMSTHLAAAFAPETDRIEFSDLAWNKLMRDPISYEDGYVIAPEVPGQGLVPDPAVLKAWATP